MGKFTVDLLSAADIYDFYGCEFVLTHATATPEDQKLVEWRLNEIYDKYLAAVRARIKSELRFLGLKPGEDASLKDMLESMSGLLTAECEKQAQKMNAGGGFNLMDVIGKAAAASGTDLSKINYKFGFDKPPEPEKARHDEGIQGVMNKDSLIKNPKWHEIAKAFQDLEDAGSLKAKIAAIDHLNNLQHNSFHLLIDLQTGRMLEDCSEGERKGKHDEAVRIVKEALELSANARNPIEFSARMTSDVAKLIREYGRIAPGRPS